MGMESGKRMCDGGWGEGVRGREAEEQQHGGGAAIGRREKKRGQAKPKKDGIETEIEKEKIPKGEYDCNGANTNHSYNVTIVARTNSS